MTQATPLGFTETKVENSALHKAPATPSLFALHRSCKTLSIAAFKEAYCNNNLQAIIISGQPSPQELNKAWEEICYEYASYFKTDNSNYIQELQQQISLLKLHIFFVDNAVYALQQHFIINKHVDLELVEGLIDYGYDVNTDTSNEEAYLHQYNRILSLCKTNVFDLEQLQEQYNRLNQTTKGQPLTEEKFDANILMLSKYQHYPIDEEKTSVYKYAIMFNNFLAEHKLKGKQHGE